MSLKRRLAAIERRAAQTPEALPFRGLSDQLKRLADETPSARADVMPGAPIDQFESLRGLAFWVAEARKIVDRADIEDPEIRRRATVGVADRMIGAARRFAEIGGAVVDANGQAVPVPSQADFDLLHAVLRLDTPQNRNEPDNDLRP